MGVTLLIASLVVTATACLGVDALQADVRADALRNGVASVDNNIAVAVGSSHGASETTPDVVRDGYDTRLHHPPSHGAARSGQNLPPRRQMYGVRIMPCNYVVEITSHVCSVQIMPKAAHA